MHLMPLMCWCSVPCVTALYSEVAQAHIALIPTAARPATMTLLVYLGGYDSEEQAAL